MTVGNRELPKPIKGGIRIQRGTAHNNCTPAAEDGWFVCTPRRKRSDRATS